jgi:hypothetical protein
MVDTCFEGHRRHLFTLFEGNPSGMGGCSSESVDVDEVAFLGQSYQSLFFEWFLALLGDPKLQIYVFRVMEFDGKLYFTKIHQEMAELPDL